ncbi:MAG: YcaQ family DNA glycosylase [Anaerolineales bacterium]|nr:YcaQ family DNA glycosylase [Anaerolineales bacterium]
MNPIPLSKSAARRIVLNAQMLNGQGGLPSGKAGVRRIFDRLGYIQIDTIHIIERSHHHTLRTRLPGYAQSMLHDLQAVDRSVFEYWAHAMAYLPMADYRFFLYKMKQFRDPAHPWLKYHATPGELPLKSVLERIRAEGPLTARDFIRPDDRKRGPWWDWGPAKSALELLFWRGELMISERRNFQKVYDLSERVLPRGIDTSVPTDREMAEHLVRQALAAMGVARVKELFAFLQSTSVRDSKFRAVSWDRMTRTIDEMAEAKTIIPAVVQGDTEESYFLLGGAANADPDIPKSKKTVRFLSPFDNLIIQRDRTRRMFDFTYTLECYLPASKRVHGYFVLPLLYGDSFAGRIDPQADRKTGTMILHSAALEKEFKPSEAFYGKLSDAIAGFAEFNGCRRVVIEKTTPAKLKSILQPRLPRG